MHVSGAHCLFVEFESLLLPPRVEIAANILFQCTVNGRPSELVANHCRSQALAESWEGL
jgi:hypothetical protein